MSTLRIALVFALACTATAALAEDEVNVSVGGTLTGKPLALHGHDPVAYFTDGRPVLGSAEHASVYQDATYYFASAAHRATFEANPAKYAPQYGGFCAYGASVGKKFDGHPAVFLVRDGKLYLNLAPAIAEKFSADVAGHIARADAQWATIRSRPAGSL
ncbi:MAG: YHS domain-containing protein [Myxococcales bacterium]|nr:YHS domain-containing protein [Myxococcales bacterium]MCB9547761.1 YHS domain-containing protein [Myxococcales bacterium]